MRKFLSGFREFIAHGNAIDMAVGIIIGVAFGAVVKALVDSIITPLIAAIFGRPSLDAVGNFQINHADFSIGKVLTALLLFILTALALYLFVVLPINTMKPRKAVDEVVPVPEDIALLTEIRDLLKK